MKVLLCRPMEEDEYEGPSLRGHGMTPWVAVVETDDGRRIITGCSVADELANAPGTDVEDIVRQQALMTARQIVDRGNRSR